MPHFFSRNADGLHHFEVNGEAVVLAPGVIARRAASPSPPRRDSWVLLVDDASRARVNGNRLATGVAVLDDRDEIATGDGSRFFVSFEAVAAVEAFPREESVACARCRLPVEPGASSVCCPRCGVWMHETAERPCFTYAAQCAACAGSTELGGALAWTPEESS